MDYAWKYLYISLLNEPPVKSPTQNVDKNIILKHSNKIFPVFDVITTEVTTFLSKI
jgi:hypothetical protein